MACPYFFPLRARPGSPTLPLGDWWQGACHAAAGEPVEPPAGGDVCCNLGYARGHCARFPEGAGADAVRFTIAAPESAPEGGPERTQGATVSIYYVAERDHRPFAHGALQYSVAEAALAGLPDSPLLARQAEAYAESYLRRKRES
jgi:hypothetical protein